MEIISRRFKPCWISSAGYQMVSVNGKIIKRASFIWNSLHPDDPIIDGEVVHHRDEDKRNDKPRNLKKMSKIKHDRLHTMKRQPLLQWKKKHSLEVKRLGRKQLETYRKDHREKFIKTATNNINTYIKNETREARERRIENIKKGMRRRYGNKNKKLQRNR